MMKIHCSKKQRGSVVVVVTIALPILLLIMGLALDFAHVFVNKTRLQNALDATALSAAITINGDVAKDANKTVRATTKGQETFNLFKASSGNAELSALNANNLNFEYSKTLNPWNKNSFDPTKDTFAFVRVKSIGMLNVTPVLIKIMSQFNKPIVVPATATAGAAGQNCSLMPFVLCANMTPLDTNCNDGSCYGYTVGQIRSLVQAPVCKGNNSDGDECETSLESGNFNLLNLDDSKGGKDIRETLQGTTNVCTQGNTLNTKPGWTWGNVTKGIDERFDSDTQTVEYKSSSYNPSAYTQYQTSGLGNGRRLIAVPIGDCRGIQNGNSTLPKVGTGCVFLTQKTSKNKDNEDNKKDNKKDNEDNEDNEDNAVKKEVMAEFVTSCEQNGVWDPNNAALNGPYKIVLFKSPASGDS
ncbi:MAG: hypothetical protein RLZ75_3070 [Pseudomonadota bacterium]|jgi:hypothetical protein